MKDEGTGDIQSTANNVHTDKTSLPGAGKGAPVYRILDQEEFSDELGQQPSVNLWDEHRLSQEHGWMNAWEGRSETHSMFRQSYE